MSDRVEEKREEQRILEQRLLTQRTEASRQQAAKAFASVVAQVQQTSKAESHRQDARQQQQAGAHEKLLARRGIDNNEFAGRLMGEGNGRMLKARQADARKGSESSLRKILEDKVQEKAGEHSLAPVQRRDGKQQKRDESSDRGVSEARRELIMGSQTGLGVFALGGTGTKQASGSGGVTAPSTQHIIEEIVKAIAVHKSALTGMGMVHIELKDSVLAGASLLLHAQPDGLSVKFRSPNEQVSRLLSAGSTAQELSQSLQAKGIKLKTLEVNDNKVIR